MRFLINWFIYALAIGMAAYILPGVRLDGVWAALLTAMILGFVNGFLRPVLFIFTLPNSTAFIRPDLSIISIWTPCCCATTARPWTE